ncbi:hypothetical protein Ga0466249_002833 [Sporomusaceae bacterium BoRhaA]|jgi:hypothetical protein|uniref:hypothetical protein n=1 Tax=Pelorhabdus rhamnosifermentans TaxID=2772457 RepID=UPI001C05F2FD|nr:hypothetical protein [Pelorhabdus rhamnosifermentans]MBU2701714.1 hypothetical protein [Pelorhabdus rhamnosifermentans]
MRETITLNRVGTCHFTGKEVAQQISGYCLEEEQRQESHVLTKYCSGESLCHSKDCQFVVGTSGKVYTKNINIAFDILKLCKDSK